MKRRGESSDSRLARVIKDIANDVQPGIELEEDHPNEYENGMMSIIDMNVWMSPLGLILYKHYEKEVSNKKIPPGQLHAKRVILRRVSNTSQMRRLHLCSLTT